MILKTLTTFIIPVLFLNGSAQMREPVQWRFDYTIIKPSQVAIRANATLAPGWHIYSQYLKDGGPVPTKLVVATNPDVHCIGLAEELGIPIQFYDALYEMDIVWYANTVTFSQPIRIDHAPIEVRGSLSYMTCNDHLCIPGNCSFSLPVTTLRRAP